MDKKRSTGDYTNESDRQFLDRTGVGNQIRDMLTKIIENRPEDPISFMADFFETQEGNLDRVAKAHQLLSTTHYTKPAYQGNVRSAYDVLSYHKKKQLKGVTGLIFMELLYLLNQNFPSKVKDEVLKRLRCRDYEVIPFDIFKSAVFTCLVLKDFLQQSKDLYQSLDPQKTDKVDRVMCETLNVQLYRAVATDTADNPSSLLEAGSLLGPEKVYSNLATAMFNTKGTKQHMSCDEFLLGTAESFLSKVKRLQ